MKKINIIVLISLGFNIIANEVDTTKAAANKKHTTFLIYVAADNDLKQFADYDLKEAQSGTNPNINTLAFYCTSTNGRNKFAKRLEITNSQIIQDGPIIPNLDSGIASSVVQAGNWAIQKYPADRFCLVFWDHGSGPLNRNKLIDLDNNITAPDMHRGVCYDYTTGHFLNDYDLQNIVSSLSQKLGRNIDVAAFDACLMAHVELAYTLQKYVNYYVASQEVEPGTGFQYQTILKLLNQNISTSQFVSGMVTSYGQCYKNSGENYTLSAINLKNINELVSNINIVSDLLISGLNSNDKNNFVKIITQAAAYNNSNIRFYEKDYIDLYCFYKNLYNTVKSYPKNTISDNLLSALLNGMNILPKCVINNTFSSNFALVKGISIYLPKTKIDPSYLKLYWSTATKWTKFLQAYFATKAKLQMSSNNNNNRIYNFSNEYQF